MSNILRPFSSSPTSLYASPLSPPSHPLLSHSSLIPFSPINVSHFHSFLSHFLLFRSVFPSFLAHLTFPCISFLFSTNQCTRIYRWCIRNVAFDIIVFSGTRMMTLGWGLWIPPVDFPVTSYRVTNTSSGTDLSEFSTAVSYRSCSLSGQSIHPQSVPYTRILLVENHTVSRPTVCTHTTNGEPHSQYHIHAYMDTSIIWWISQWNQTVILSGSVIAESTSCIINH